LLKVLALFRVYSGTEVKDGGFDRSTPDSCSCHNTGGKSGSEGITGTVLKAKHPYGWATVVAGGGGAGEGLLRLCKAKTTSIFMV
jgi:hypothetical protein